MVRLQLFTLAARCFLRRGTVFVLDYIRELLDQVFELVVSLHFSKVVKENRVAEPIVKVEKLADLLDEARLAAVALPLDKQDRNC